MSAPVPRGQLWLCGGAGGGVAMAIPMSTPPPPSHMSRFIPGSYTDELLLRMPRKTM